MSKVTVGCGNASCRTGPEDVFTEYYSRGRLLQMHEFQVYCAETPRVIVTCMACLPNGRRFPGVVYTVTQRHGRVL